MKYLTRKKYLDELIDLNNTPDIKVITGLRRSGKSVLLKEYENYLRKNENNINIISINLQDLDFDNLLEYHNLHKYVMDKFVEGTHNVLIIDEVQMCNNFELVINSLHSKGLFDIYITGSNAFLLSSDLATLFTGRTIRVDVFPFSFSEFVEFHQYTDYETAFEEYLIVGGMPGAYHLKSNLQKSNYTRDVYETILIRDLVEKYNIRNVDDFHRVAEYMMDNIGNLLSPNNICEILVKDKSSITRKTVSKYIDYLENSFLFYKAKRYDLKGKKYLVNNNKYYLSDISFRYSINGTNNMDFGRTYENLVYLELLRRGYNVYVGKLYKKEVDFIATKQNEKIYIQVCDYLDNPKTFERECSSLLEISDAYPKMIIARTHHKETQYEGIRVVDIISWLLNK